MSWTLQAIRKEREKRGLKPPLVCAQCGRAIKICDPEQAKVTPDREIASADHIRPKAEGWDGAVWDWRNLQPMCKECNGGKGCNSG
jgi:5-methylcytosine-specific restriction endonuclease McrA